MRESVLSLGDTEKMEVENGKRNAVEIAADVVGKRPRTEEENQKAGENKEDDGVTASWLMLDEDSAMELSNLLELWDAPPPPMKVRFIDDPYSSSLIFQSSSAYVTINGNEETCGSSFSDSDSSVMASIDMSGVKRVVLGEANEQVGRAFGADAGERKGFGVKEVNGYDYSGNFCDDDFGDDTWQRFLGEDVFGSQ